MSDKDTHPAGEPLGEHEVTRLMASFTAALARMDRDPAEAARIEALADRTDEHILTSAVGGGYTRPLDSADDQVHGAKVPPARRDSHTRPRRQLRRRPRPRARQIQKAATRAEVRPPANEAHNQPRHDLLGRLVIPIVVALVVAIIGSTPPLFARGSIGWALGLWGFAAAGLAAVGTLATTTGRRRAMWDRVKRFPVKTVLAGFLAAALGLGAGWSAFGSGNTPTVNRAAYIGHIVQWVNGGGQPNTSWLVGSNGERYWIPDTSIFSCLKKEGHTDLGPQSSTVLDDLPDSGQRASCA
jgi:hypothetical protein